MEASHFQSGAYADAVRFLKERKKTNERKVTEFVSSFMGRHIGRVERRKDFQMSSFLEQFFKFTFNLPSIRSFLYALDVWDSFVEHVGEMEVSTQVKAK